MTQSIMDYLSKKTLSWTAGLITSLLMASTAQAVTILATDDAFIRGTTQADNNFGSAATLTVNPNSPINSSTRKVYIQFDLSSLNVSQITDATLDLVTTGDTQGALTMALWSLNDLNAGENWDQSTITWNNAPENDTSDAVNLLGGATQLGSFAYPANSSGDTVSISLAGVLSTLQADTNDVVTFILAGDSVGGNTFHAFQSLEAGAGTGPVLNVTLIPEPSTYAALFGGLVLCSVMVARRKQVSKS